MKRVLIVPGKTKHSSPTATHDQATDEETSKDESVQNQGAGAQESKLIEGEGDQEQEKSDEESEVRSIFHYNWK